MANVLPHLGLAKVESKKVDKQLVTPKIAGNSPLLVHTIAQPVHERGIEDLKKRAKNKHFSSELARHLVCLRDSPLNKAYRRTLFDCNALLIQEGYSIRSKYCNARWCNNCNRMRTAKLVDAYRKPLQAFSDPYFVTLTIPNVEGEDLRKAILLMLKTIKNIIRARRRICNLNGIRKIECTYNLTMDTYHPHFHFIIDGFENAEYIYDQWLKRYPTASHKGQDICKADTESLMELFKYTTKIITKTKEQGYSIHIKPLDTIFQAMHKLRTFQPIGKVRMVSEDVEPIKKQTYSGIPYYESAVHIWGTSDWYSMLTGDALTGYEPSKRMIELTTEKIIP